MYSDAFSSSFDLTPSLLSLALFASVPSSFTLLIFVCVGFHIFFFLSPPPRRRHLVFLDMQLQRRLSSTHRLHPPAQLCSLFQPKPPNVDSVAGTATSPAPAFHPLSPVVIIVFQKFHNTCVCVHIINSNSTSFSFRPTLPLLSFLTDSNYTTTRTNFFSSFDHPCLSYPSFSLFVPFLSSSSLLITCILPALFATTFRSSPSYFRTSFSSSHKPPSCS